MKVISGFFTLLALIAFSTSSSADQLQSDLNTCTVERELLKEKVVTLESETLKRQVEGSNLDLTNSRNTDQVEVKATKSEIETLGTSTCERESNQTLYNFQKCQRELAAEIERFESERRQFNLTLETYQKGLNDASSTTQEPITKRKTTTESTTTSTSTTSRPDYRCGTLLDVATNDPAVKGFLSGHYKDGSPIYPGSGYFHSHGDRPAKVYKQPNLALHQFDNSQHSTDRDVKFIASHPNLQWVSTDNRSVKKLLGRIAIKQNNGHDHYITRHNITGYQQIGAYQAVANTVWYWTDKLVASGNVQFEVLVCD